MTPPARAGDPPASVYLAVRRAFPEIAVARLPKRALVPMTHAFEDEVLARSRRPLVFGGFQREAFLRAALPRWQRLAQSARAVVVFADGLREDAAVPGIRHVDLAHDAPLREEWAVVCDDPDFGIVISAWEIPGQESVPDGDRHFEVVWSLEAGPIRAAARACLSLSLASGLPEAGRFARELDGPPPPGPDVRTVSDVLAGVLRRVGEAGRCPP